MILQPIGKNELEIVFLDSVLLALFNFKQGLNKFLL
jgi:hypothetical protein